MSYKRVSPQPVVEGGSGVTTMTTAYAPVCAGTTATAALQVASTGLATSGYVLTSTGSASLPTFQASPAASISVTGDTGGALTGGAFTFGGGATGLKFNGGGSTETLGGTLAVASGGTGTTTLTGVVIGNGGVGPFTASAITQYDVLVGGATNTITSIAPPGAGGIPLISNGSASNPSFSTAVVAGGGTGVTTMTTAYAPVCAGTTATGNLQVASTGLSTSGFVLTSTGASSLPTWQAAGTGYVGTIAGDSGTATGSTITIKAGTSVPTCGSSVTFTASAAQLALTVTDASDNTIIGLGAGKAGITATDCTGLGHDSLAALTSGIKNTAIGSFTLASNTNGAGNTALGWNSLANAISGTNNTGLGYGALENIVNGGTNNTAIGYLAGYIYGTTESNNILINHGGVGGENNILRIGAGTGLSAGQINAAYISGITGINVGAVPAVLVNSSGQLGVNTSSIRFKENVQDMGDASSKLLNLRPVTYNFIADENKATRTGLIAEEVLKEMPELVYYNDKGEVETVLYHELPALLLNELQKAVKRIEALEAQLANQ